ncbi:putative Heat shock protein HSP14.7/HSP23.5/HSP23.6 [Helianthus annuus]|nr:putative Heat shock protein HSP14.7/HSP23.5/HSP23.6 [Helianthus annuus]
MASSLRLITSNVVARSVVPTVVSASRVLSIHRTYSTMPKDGDFSDQSPVSIKCPKISSLNFDMWLNHSYGRLNLKIPTEGMNVELRIHGLEIKDMMACAEHNTLFIQGTNLPENTSSDIKEEMKDGVLKVTLPNKDESQTNYILTNIANHIIASFRDITAKHSWLYYGSCFLPYPLKIVEYSYYLCCLFLVISDMFSDRSILGKVLCPVIATLPSVNSFSICKSSETAQKLNINLGMPANEEMKLTMQGLRMSLNMGEMEREDVKTFFEYDTFFIEGKTKKNHYITGIRLPEGIHMKHNMMKREMKDGHSMHFFLV